MTSRQCIDRRCISVQSPTNQENEMAFIITMSNPGGELDRRTAKDGTEAVEVLSAMINDCGELADGDTFTIVDEDEAA
jgi:hypothetical protein